MEPSELDPLDSVAQVLSNFTTLQLATVGSIKGTVKACHSSLGVPQPNWSCSEPHQCLAGQGELALRHQAPSTFWPTITLRPLEALVSGCGSG